MRAPARSPHTGLPRAQSGPNPQHLLATILGEYLDSADADLPSAAVVAVLREFGISDTSARAALSRLTRRGLVAARRPGRPAVYHLTPAAIARHRSRMDQFLTFGARPPRWTGEWTVAAFSLPETSEAQRVRQAQRHEVRKALGALGLVRLYDSMWIKPGDDRARVDRALRDVLGDLGAARWSVMSARFDDEAGPHGPTAAYDLDGLAAAYSAFIGRYAPLLDAVRVGRVGAAEALVARTSVMDSWRTFADTDPDLPDHLLPAPWPRREARELFLEIHSALGPLAQARLVEITEPHWPDAASWITHFRHRD
ncbi:PaaX family transcriptional regulator [Jidongwangia harbinensis]|uniref:PaaX family transcriptional regulator n=1 Tax=Jidongwangia harbinensis TaxID=2878561 RepID=UPI001CDA41C9|nr:PaaX family transcriptional regulator C-terminal domain-containing protein [Jidongwangia harbinensis]MCA2215511.1 PaaX family transcriptional regulator [Jidongwangia harbinensis]